ncbi:hypothetical protein BDW72DRAFT_186417 [Aspergillus terricola var. indicus]
MAPSNNVKRPGQACTQCRKKKTRCSGDSAPCERCAMLGLDCTLKPANTAAAAFPPRSQQHQQHRPAPLTPSDGSPCTRSRVRNGRFISSSRKESLEAMRTGKSSSRIRVRPRPARDACLLPTVAAATPYSSVQKLEPDQQSCSAAYPTPSESQGTGDRRDWVSSPDAQCSDRDRTDLAACLAEVAIPPAEALELFTLFGERISPFIPSLYATDFRTLPSQPLYVLAAIYAVARYLPDSTALCDRVGRILRRLISELIFRPTANQSDTAKAENMQGLVVLYACCEATGPNHEDQQAFPYFDMLFLKGIAETYAAKIKLGLDCPLDKVSDDRLPLVWVVWLYTMSHHCAVLHGCPRTLSDVELLRVKSALEQTVDHPRIRLLLGECELCLLWERAFSIQGSCPKTVHDLLDQWKSQWQDFLTGAAAPSQQLYFLFYFTRFHLLTHLVDEAGEIYIAMNESLDAAQDFLQWFKDLSPISKDRLRYLCDIAFVLMAHVCLYVVRALRSGLVLARIRKEFLQLVQDAAVLMQSLSVRLDTRPAIYGCTLVSMCRQYQTSQIDGISAGAASSLRDSAEANLPRQAELDMELPMAAEALMDEELLRQSRLSPGFWTLEPDISVFDGIIASIPVFEESC